jgi:hypothetical protein
VRRGRRRCRSPQDREASVQAVGRRIRCMTRLRNGSGLSSLTSQIRNYNENQMSMLPVDRALSIYGALANRLEAKGARKGLTARRYLEGERDEHELTVEGLSYLQGFHREIDSRD